MFNFVFPNEVTMQWDLLIVIYPFITGLVAGAFIVSSLYHVFGIAKLKPVARFSLLTALAFLLVAPLPLVIHLGQQQRALEMLLRPNFTSAMAGFGFIWMFYLIIVMGEIWLVFRKDIVTYYQNSVGLKKTIYSILALGVYDISEKSLTIDKKIIKILAFIGIPAACLLHGYVGFIFGAIKANPWWSTPLMPIIFLLSAIVSGIALLIVLYVIVSKIRKAQLDIDCINTMGIWLAGFLSVAIVVEGLEIIMRLYESEESWQIIKELITQKLAFSYMVLQYGSGMFIPIIILASILIVKLKPRIKLSLQFLASALILVGVFAMRWNVVVGGQLVSKSLRGFSDYTPPLMGENGMLVALCILVAPFVLFGVITYLIPPWKEEIHVSLNKGLSYQTAKYK